MNTIPDYEKFKSYIFDNPSGSYVTHDNGGRQFKVIVNGNDINVYEENEKEMERFESDYSFLDQDGFFHTLLRKKYTNVLKVFIGLYYMTQREVDLYSWTTYSNKTMGNTILIYLGKKDGKYVYNFISDDIRELRLDDEIIDYYSHIGNNDVPYPLAISKNYVYNLGFFEAIEKKYYILGSGESLGEEKFTTFLYDRNDIPKISFYAEEI